MGHLSAQDRARKGTFRVLYKKGSRSNMVTWEGCRIFMRVEQGKSMSGMDSEVELLSTIWSNLFRACRRDVDKAYVEMLRYYARDKIRSKTRQFNRLQSVK